MEHPAPITWFSRFYIAALALKTIFAIVHWDVVDAGTVQIGIIVALLLWFGVMYRHSVVSKWLIILSFVVSAIWTLGALAVGRYDVVSALVFIAAVTLNGMAAWQLIAGPAHRWFEEPHPAD